MKDKEKMGKERSSSAGLGTKEPLEVALADGAFAFRVRQLHDLRELSGGHTGKAA